MAAQDGLERFGEIATHVAVLIHVDVAEECLVERATQVVRRSPVCLVAVLRQCQGGCEICLDLAFVGLEAREPLVDRCQPLRHGSLFRRVQVGGDDAAEMTVEELSAAFLQTDLLACQGLGHLSRVGAALADFLPQYLLDAFPKARVQGDPLVIVDDPRFNECDRDGGRLAAVSVRVASAADEVGVQRAVTVRGVLDDESAPTLATEDSALEIVRMVPRLLAHGIGRHDVLHALPRGARDELLVAARIARSLKLDRALVIGIREDLVELGRRDGLRGTRRGRR